MTKEQLAQKLNGREYGDEITYEESAAAKSDGLVVIFGYSDDNVELRGAIDDEISMWDGGTLYLHQGGCLDNPDDIDCDRCIKQLKQKQKKCIAIACCWDAEPYSWIIKPEYDNSIPFASFEIVEGKDKFCRGIVVRLEDLPQINED